MVFEHPLKPLREGKPLIMPMKRIFQIFLLTVSSLIISKDCLFAQEEQDCQACIAPLPPLQLYIGPEGYHIKRTRKGGTKQTGNMWGGRAGFDYIKQNDFYWGMEGYYTTGMLKGHSGGGFTIKSRNQEWELEGRFGYTFQSDCFPYYTLTPFAAYGYFEEHNHFLKDFPFSVDFENQFHYVAGGFLSNMFITSRLNAGLQFKVSYITKGANHVRNDPDIEDFSTQIENKFQYSVDLPINYLLCENSDSYELSFVPFFRTRHYGGRRGFPFDFLETKYTLAGARVLFTYLF